MPNNLETPNNAPEKAESKLSIDDLPKLDVKALGDGKFNDRKNDSETMTKFDGQGSSKFEIAGNEIRPAEYGASAELNQDGSLNNVEIKDGHVQTTFQASENGFSRTRVSGAGREVTQFDKDGKPTSYKSFTGPEDTEGTEYPVKPDDRLNITTNENGDLEINSIDKRNDSTSKIIVDKDGHVSEAEKLAFNEKTETVYNNDGSVLSNSVTQFGPDGLRDRQVVTNNFGTTTSEFDDSGKIIRDHLKGETFERDTIWDENGNQISNTDFYDGTSVREVSQPDGTTYAAGKLEDSNYFTKTEPDGSKTTSIEAEDYSSYEIADPEGNWVKYHKNKNSGVSTVTRGDRDGAYIGKLEERGA